MSFQVSSKDVLELLDRAGGCLEWVGGGNRPMYFWKVKYTIEELIKNMNKMVDTMTTAVGTMRSARHNRKNLSNEAVAWVREAIEMHHQADSVLERYSPVASVVFFLCETVSRHNLKAEAIRRINSIEQHLVMGKKYNDGSYEDVVSKVQGDGGDHQDKMLKDLSEAVATCKVLSSARTTGHTILVFMTMGGMPPVVHYQTAAETEHGASNSIPAAATISLLEAAEEHGASIPHAAVQYQEERAAVPKARRRKVRPAAGKVGASITEVAKASKRPAELDHCQKQKEEEEEDYFLFLDAPSGGESAVHDKVKLSAFPDHRALARSQALDGVPVLVRVSAPRFRERTRFPVDLVMLLDCGGGGRSMAADDKMDMIRQSSMFVIHNLDAEDRMSIVLFSDKEEELLPLSHMDNRGKSEANQLIASLTPSGSGDSKAQRAAMDLASKILSDNELYEDRAGAILLLTDGGEIFEKSSTEGLTSASTVTSSIPVYTLGLGVDHDPRLLYSLAARARGPGTYSFGGGSSINDAAALCVGGLTSIVARNVHISVRSDRDGDVTISGITAGGYRCSVDDGGKSGSIFVDDLCAGEDKNFVVYVNIPKEEAAGGGVFSDLLGAPRTKLLSVTAAYSYPSLSRKGIVRTSVDSIEVSVERPGKVRPQDRCVSLEVASEVTRNKVLEGVWDIWQGIGSGEPNWLVVGKNLMEKLDGLRGSVAGTEEAMAAGESWDVLSSDLDSMRKEAAEAVRLGRGTAPPLHYMLSWLSSHQRQRAATMGYTPERGRWLSFRTVRMQNMIDAVDTAPSAYIR